ncbi:hypothetical protein K2P47_05335 [Patescibacteria group bacterium]|nr:hypothetical protein [Patescibacteria group bacterium]
MKNIHTRTIALILGIVAFGYHMPTAFAHSVVVSETKDVGDYTLVMEATAHYPDIYINDPVMYDFRIYEKGTENAVPYDSSYIYLSKKSGPVIFQTETPAPRDPLPGSQVIASVPDAGEYEFEVFFNRAEEGEVKTTFNFTSIATSSNNNMEVSTSSNTEVPNSNNEKSSNKIPPVYVLGGIALFALGGLLGGFVKKNKI